MIETEQGICIKCNVPISKAEIMVMTEEGEMDIFCFNYKGKTTNHICKRCGRNWYCLVDNCDSDIHDYCPVCFVQGCERLEDAKNS